MTHRKINISLKKAEELRSLLKEKVDANAIEHLLDEDYIGYSTNTLSNERMVMVIAHLKVCGECAEQLEDYLERAGAINKAEISIKLRTLKSRVLEKVKGGK